MKTKSGKTCSNYVWTFTTYFTEGFPFVLIRTITPVFFRDLKVPLESIGLTSLFGVPWILKFLWGPWVDQYGTKRRWLLGTQAILWILFMVVALLVPLPGHLKTIAVIFFAASFIAATHDIAIDGYYMEALDKDGQAQFVGYRVMAYRIAMMAGTGGIVTLAAYHGWFAAFLGAGILFGLFLLFHVFALDEVQSPRENISRLFTGLARPRTFMLFAALTLGAVIIYYFFQSSTYLTLKTNIPILKNLHFSHWTAIVLLLALVLVWFFRKRLLGLMIKDPDSHYGKAFLYFIAEREKVGVILSFIILLRLGEWTLSNMAAPFMVDLGIKVHYGWISAWVGLPAAIFGALAGGWMISRFSLKKVLWPFILAQNFTNIIYMALAIHLARFLALNTGVDDPTGIGGFNLLLVALTHGFDQFAAGLGNAVLMTYLMRICHKEYKAAHYAVGTALMNVSAPFAGVMSGIIAGKLGYAWLFGLSFAASIPAMVLIPFLPYVSDSQDSQVSRG